MTLHAGDARTASAAALGDSAETKRNDRSIARDGRLRRSRWHPGDRRPAAETCAQRAANSSQRRRDRGTPRRRKPSLNAFVIGGGPHMYTQTSARLRPAVAFSAVRKPSLSATTTCGTKFG